VILSEHTTTGDGLVTALALLNVMVRTGRPLSELARVMCVYPQTLINVRVEQPGAAKAVASSEDVGRAVASAKERLGGEGRILLRPSGTEPVVRVMVEHTDESVCRKVCEEIAGVVSAAGANADREVRA
jgi:phosphoglucosamine mutase